LTSAVVCDLLHAFPGAEALPNPAAETVITAATIAIFTLES
jgi:hypothetical protein